MESVAVVAHNPGITYCVNLLCGRNVIDSLPTLGIARVHWPGEITDLVAGEATLEVLMSPKRLP